MKNFKQFLLVMSIVFGGLSTTYAQQGLSFGVSAMPQNTWMFNSDDSDNSDYEYKATLGAAFGLNAGYNFNDNMGIGVDVLYSLQGQKSEIDGVEFTQKNDYLKIPLYFSYNSDPSSKVMFMGKVGPQLGLLLNSKLVDADGEDLIDDSSDAFASTTFGAMLGAGVGFRLSEQFLLNTGLRFDFEFTNAEDEDYEFYNSERASTNNATASLEISLKYLLGR